MIDQYYDPTPSSSLFGSDLDAANTTSEETPEESRRQPMRVIVFASQKGGSGKTTLCGQLAVEADRAGAGPVALIDTDPQGSLADWWNARASDTPAFVKTSFAHMKEDLEELRAQGTKLVFIDTPPAVADTIKAVVGHADLVVIPTRPSPHDLRAVGATVDIIEGLGKPLVFAVNGATPRARITGEAAVALSQHGTGVGLVWKIEVIDLVRFWCRDGRPKTAIRDNGPLQGRILSRRQGRAGEGGNAPHRQKRYDAVS